MSNPNPGRPSTGRIATNLTISPAVRAILAHLGQGNMSDAIEQLALKGISLEACHPQEEILDGSGRDPDGSWHYAGMEIFEIYPVNDKMADPLFVASAAWCAEHGIPMKGIE